MPGYPDRRRAPAAHAKIRLPLPDIRRPGGAQQQHYAQHAQHNDNQEGPDVGVAGPAQRQGADGRPGTGTQGEGQRGACCGPRPVALRIQLHYRSGGGPRHQPGADAGQQAGQAQLVDIGCQHEGYGAAKNEQQARHQHLSTSNLIRQRAHGQQRQYHAQHINREHRSQCGRRKAPRLLPYGIQRSRHVTGKNSGEDRQ